MSLSDFYNSKAGQSLDYDGIEADRGQCVQWAFAVLTEFYGLPPHYGNAIDWWNKPGNLLDNFDKVSVGEYPKAGDFVIWGAGVGSQYGHIDVCLSDGNLGGFLGADSNWNGNKTVHQERHDYRFVIGYLRRKGGDMPTLTTAGNLEDLTLLATGRSSQGDPNLKNLIGQDIEETIRYFVKLPEHLALLDRAAKNGSSDAQKKLDQIKAVIG